MTKDQLNLRLSIHGVGQEIKRRANILRQMKFYREHPATSATQYTEQYMISHTPILEREIKKLKLIKIELTYLHELTILG
jgi:hypothetical protein